MARYQRPTDPRHPQDDGGRSESSLSGPDPKEPIPWKWLGLGVIVSIIGLVLAAVLIAFFLVREPIQVSLPTPTIIRLTAPPSPDAAQASPFPSATPIPTLTPPATPDLSIAPEVITIGYYAVVANTEDIGVSLRGGPSTDNLRLELVPEAAALLVIGGPEEGSGFIWWQVRLANGTEGWVAGDFLLPAAAPEASTGE